MVKPHDVAEMLEEAFSSILENKDPENEIIMCDTKRTKNPNELQVTFTNNDLSEDKYIINITSLPINNKIQEKVSIRLAEIAKDPLYVIFKKLKRRLGQ